MIVENLEYQQKPTLINLNLTNFCNFRCLHCPMDHNYNEFYKKQSANFEKLKSHLLGLKKWLKNYVLNISGGEPFLYPKLFELLDFCAKQKIIVHLQTNGSLFTNSIIQKLAKSEVHTLSVSIDGFEKTHDFIRGVPGSFKRSISGLKKLDELIPKFKNNLTYTIMSHNIVETPNFVKWAKTQSYIKNITFQAIQIKDVRKYKEDLLWPKFSQVVSSLDQLIDLRKKKYKIVSSITQLSKMKEYFLDPIRVCKIPNEGCSVRYTNYFIESDNKIIVCPLSSEFKYGSIGDTNDLPRLIWNSKKANTVKNKISKCKQTCMVSFNCSFSDKVLVKMPKYCFIDLSEKIKLEELEKFMFNAQRFLKKVVFRLKKLPKKNIFYSLIKKLAKEGIEIEFKFLEELQLDKNLLKLLRLGDLTLNIKFKSYIKQKELVKQIQKYTLNKVKIVVTFPYKKDKELTQKSIEEKYKTNFVNEFQYYFPKRILSGKKITSNTNIFSNQKFVKYKNLLPKTMTKQEYFFENILRSLFIDSYGNIVLGKYFFIVKVLSITLCRLAIDFFLYSSSGVQRSRR